MVEPVPLTSIQKAVYRLKKKKMKTGNSDVLRSRYKVTVPFPFLALFQNTEHLQDTLLNKLLDQFIELHNTHFLKK